MVAEPLFRMSLSPLLKWAGGKRWLVKHLEPYWRIHRHRIFVEPFVGGMGVTLGLLPEKALLNDANYHLINFYEWVRRGLNIDIPLVYDRDIYLSHRARFNRLIREGKADTAEAAALFYYLNRTGYNGLCRFNASGEFNVPFGKYKTINYQTDFTAYKQTFRGWEFTSGDFSKMEFDSDSFVYADPPYDVEFTHYSPGGFSWADQVRLVEFLEPHRGPVIISNQLTDRIYVLYKKFGYSVRTLSAPRRISCNGNRQDALEVLAFKNIEP
ncbi:Dam family site-specific DNA-(adenine-N6)-methyltransferase [Meiothermus sp.]|uniref:DNA adenine methylase n=1 Tax=Meiothermus sp. TaxID=1955249 RepID=UPI0021DCAF4D|nr:Dam family site-specific DNA-(adenine-N6)-methyltransferase [Meiothermus sp.]GIW35835.1 MAG: site-specific DNA-methyltransferase (adenine-specific) [Meiothermus sp.]